MANKKQRKHKNRNNDATTDPSFVERLALFGDSGVALFSSFALLVLAIGVSWKLDQTERGPNTPTKLVLQEEDKFEVMYQKLGPIPALDPARVLSIHEDSIDSIQKAYEKEGVVAIRGLIPLQLLHRIDLESKELVERQTSNRKQRNNQQFYAQHHGAAFLDPPNVAQDQGDENLGNVTAFLEIAVVSQVPKLASRLMLSELKEGESVRMLRDIFLTRSADQNFACGWHVDDTGFWPATAAAPGVNAWIALDDMPAVGGGGFALAVGSHVSSWRHEAQHITGATAFFPAEGYKSAADMFENRTGYGTCNIQTSAPHLYRRMEETKRIYNLTKGDVIFHQRWMFHRTVPFEKDNAKQAESDNQLYRRYSLRYSPGSAVIPPGYGTELSVLWNEENGNRTADSVSQLDGPWYPKVWPTPDFQELRSLKSLVNDKMPIAEERKSLRKKEMQPFLKQAARQQSKPGRMA